MADGSRSITFTNWSKVSAGCLKNSIPNKLLFILCAAAAGSDNRCWPKDSRLIPTPTPPSKKSLWQSDRDDRGMIYWTDWNKKTKCFAIHVSGLKWIHLDLHEKWKLFMSNFATVTWHWPQWWLQHHRLEGFGGNKQKKYKLTFWKCAT